MERLFNSISVTKVIFCHYQYTLNIQPNHHDKASNSKISWRRNNPWVTKFPSVIQNIKTPACFNKVLPSAFSPMSSQPHVSLATCNALNTGLHCYSQTNSVCLVTTINNYGVHLNNSCKFKVMIDSSISERVKL